jgi:hypothetical protein
VLLRVLEEIVNKMRHESPFNWIFDEYLRAMDASIIGIVSESANESLFLKRRNYTHRLLEKNKYSIKMRVNHAFGRNVISFEFSYIHGCLISGTKYNPAGRQLQRPAV